MFLRSPHVRLAGLLLTLAMALLAGSSAAAGAVVPTPNPPWKGLPTRTQTSPHSGAGDVVNIALEGSRNEVLAGFKKIGWLQADPLSLKNDDRLARATLNHGKYPTAPVSRQYLFGRIEDFAVEKELGSVYMRDHARFWDTGKQDSSTHLELWIGAASRDIGIKIVRRHRVLFGTTHRIDGHIDTERDLVVQGLQSAGLVTSVVSEPGVGAQSNLRNGGGDLITTDGKARLLVLK